MSKRHTCAAPAWLALAALVSALYCTGCVGLRRTVPTLIPDGGTPLVPPAALEQIHLDGLEPGSGSAHPVAVDGPSFDRALLLRVHRDVSPSWATKLVIPTTGSVRKGDVVHLRLQARMDDLMFTRRPARFVAVFQKNSPDWEKSLWHECTVTGHEWQLFDLPFRAHESLAAGQAALEIQFGFASQRFQIGGLELLNFGDRVDINALPSSVTVGAGPREQIAGNSTCR